MRALVGRTTIERVDSGPGKETVLGTGRTKRQWNSCKVDRAQRTDDRYCLISSAPSLANKKTCSTPAAARDSSVQPKSGMFNNGNRHYKLSLSDQFLHHLAHRET